MINKDGRWSAKFCYVLLCLFLAAFSFAGKIKYKLVPLQVDSIDRIQVIEFYNNYLFYLGRNGPFDSSINLIDTAGEKLKYDLGNLGSYEKVERLSAYKDKHFLIKSRVLDRSNPCGKEFTTLYQIEENGEGKRIVKLKSVPSNTRNSCSYSKQNNYGYFPESSFNGMTRICIDTLSNAPFTIIGGQTINQELTKKINLAYVNIDKKYKFDEEIYVFDVAVNNNGDKILLKYKNSDVMAIVFSYDKNTQQFKAESCTVNPDYATPSELLKDRPKYGEIFSTKCVEKIYVAHNKSGLPIIEALYMDHSMLDQPNHELQPIAIAGFKNEVVLSNKVMSQKDYYNLLVKRSKIKGVERYELDKVLLDEKSGNVVFVIKKKKGYVCVFEDDFEWAALFVKFDKQDIQEVNSNN